jgi:hypothetical protein
MALTSRIARRRELVAAITAELDARGRGPATTLVDPLGRLVVRDRRGALVATVGEWPAPHRPGLVTEARTPTGRPWTATAAA